MCFILSINITKTQRDRYEVSDPPVSMDGLHGPSDIGQSGLRNPLGGGPLFVSFTNMVLVLLLGVLCS